MKSKLTVLQLLPHLELGGVERGTLEVGKYLVENDHRSLVVSGGGRMVKQLEQEGSTHFTLPIGKKSLFTFRHFKALRDIILKNDVNIVHIRSRFPAWVNYIAMRGIEKSKRPKLISTIHGAYSVSPYSKIMLKADKIIAISQFIESYIHDNYSGIDHNKITIIHRGISSEDFPANYSANEAWLEAWHKEFPQTKDKILLTLPGRITRWKGQEDFLDIVHGLKTSGMDFHALIVGGFDTNKQHFFNELQNKSQQLSLQNYVSFVGSRPDIKQILSISDLVYSLSKKPEPFGRTSPEALTMGKPVVAYDHGGAHEVLSELFPQGLCKANNVDDAIVKTQEILSKPYSIKPNELFTSAKMLEKTLQLYLSTASEIR